MSSHIICTLDGIAPGQLDERILVTDVRQDAPVISRSTARRARGDGSLVTDEARLSLSVTVKVLVKEADPARRGPLLDLLADWSRGTVLRLGDRPRRFLTVRCERLFTPGGAQDWTKELTLTFTARQVPYWQEEGIRSLTLTEDAWWYVPGTAPETPVSFTVTNVGEGPVTCFGITAGSSVSLDGLLLKSGCQVRGTAEDGLLTLTLVTPEGEESAAEYLTTDSADVLTVPCGKRTAVRLTSDGSLSVRLTARGRYL